MRQFTCFRSITCLILIATGLSLGCARQITCKISFDKSVDFFEKKYSVSFNRDREVVRYADISGLLAKLQKALDNDELPALPVMLSAFIVQQNKGTIVKTRKYDPAEGLEFSDQIYRVSVKPGSGDTSSIRVRREGLTADLFSRDAKQYLNIVRDEIESGKFQVQYRRTNLKNYGAVAKGIIDISRDRAKRK